MNLKKSLILFILSIGVFITAIIISQKEEMRFNNYPVNDYHPQYEVCTFCNGINHGQTCTRCGGIGLVEVY
jgi:hypothetical protein